LLLDGEHGRVGDRGLPLVDGLHSAHGDGWFFGRRRRRWFFGRHGRSIDRRGHDLAAFSRLSKQPPEEVDAGDEREEGQEDEDNEFLLNAAARSFLFVRFPENFPLVILFRNPPEPTEEFEAGGDHDAR